MIELIFIACVVGSPDACEERSLLYQGRVNPIACAMAAPPYLAAWTEEHPRYTVVSWRCQDPERRRERA